MFMPVERRKNIRCVMTVLNPGMSRAKLPDFEGLAMFANVATVRAPVRDERVSRRSRVTRSGSAAQGEDEGFAQTLEDQLTKSGRARRSPLSLLGEPSADGAFTEQVTKEHAHVEQRGFAGAVCANEHAELPQLDVKLVEAAIPCRFDARNHVPGSLSLARNSRYVSAISGRSSSRTFFLRRSRRSTKWPLVRIRSTSSTSSRISSPSRLRL